MALWTQSSHRFFRFAAFEVDLWTGEIRKNGAKLKVQNQPLKVLAILLARPGELVTREQLHEGLWPNDTFVDFERGLNTAVNRLRAALNDSAENPRFVETVGSRGYRFIAPVSNDVLGKTENAVEDSVASRRVYQLPSASHAMAPVSSEETEGARFPRSSQPAVENLGIRKKKLWTVVTVLSAAVVGWVDFLATGHAKIGAASAGTDMPVPYTGAEVGAWQSVLSRKTALVSIALLTGIALVAWFVPSPTAPVVLQVRPITKDGRAKGVYATVATDGPRVYFQEVSSGREIVTQVSASGGESQEIPIPFKGTIYDISPNGSQMLFGAEMSGGIQLWIQPLPGGPPSRVGDLLASDAAWAPDGEHLVCVNGRSLFWARADGSEVRQIASMHGSADWAMVSPDGQKIRLTVEDPTRSSQTLWEVGSDGDGLKPLLPGWKEAGDQCCGRWTEDGKYYIFQNTRDGASDLWVLPERRNWWTGSRSEPIRLTHGPLQFFLPQPSRDSKMIFALGQQLNSELVRYDLNSRAFVLYLGGISANHVEISPEGGWVSYVAYPEGTLWRCRLDGSSRLQLTDSQQQIVGRPRWSPDGMQIAFAAWRRGAVFSTFLVSANGGPARKFLPDRARNPAWSPDGTQVAFNRFVPGEKPGDPDSMHIEFEDLASQKISIVPSSEGLYLADWSRDGQYLLAKTSDHHRALLFDIPTKRWSTVAEATMLTNLQFSRKGDFVYFEATSTSLAVLMRMRVADRKIEQVMDFRNVRRPLAQLSAAWSGLSEDNSPLIQRDIGTQEIYALEWNAR